MFDDLDWSVCVLDVSMDVVANFLSVTEGNPNFFLDIEFDPEPVIIVVRVNDDGLWISDVESKYVSRLMVLKKFFDIGFFGEPGEYHVGGIEYFKPLTEEFDAFECLIGGAHDFEVTECKSFVVAWFEFTKYKNSGIKKESLHGHVVIVRIPDLDMACEETLKPRLESNRELHL